MRYRRISYRFAEVSGRTSVRLWGDPWASLPTIVIARPQWRPPTDIYETPDAYILRVELAGVAEDQIELMLYQDVLVVEGTRSCDTPASARYHTAEIRYGRFRVELGLPADIDRDRVDARYEAGFLSVTLPKVERARA